MQVTLHVLYVKPETVKWFREVYPEKNQEIQAAIRSFPGLVSHDRTIVDENTLEVKLVFESNASYVAYQELWKTMQSWVDRTAYNNANSIISFFSESYD